MDFRLHACVPQELRSVPDARQQIVETGVLEHRDCEVVIFIRRPRVRRPQSFRADTISRSRGSLSQRCCRRREVHVEQNACAAAAPTGVHGATQCGGRGTVQGRGK